MAACSADGGVRFGRLWETISWVARVWVAKGPLLPWENARRVSSSGWLMLYGVPLLALTSRDASRYSSFRGLVGVLSLLWCLTVGNLLLQIEDSNC